MKVRFLSLVLVLVMGAFAQEKEVPSLVPLSSLVAVTSRVSIPDQVRKMVLQYAGGSGPEQSYFPLENTITDTVRSLEGFHTDVVVSWMDPLTSDASADAPRFGANADFVSYFGEGWNSDWEGDVVGSSPMFNGASDRGWLWVNHEYVSNDSPTTSSAPTGQMLTYARFLQGKGLLANVTGSAWTQEQVDEFLRWEKTQIGGSWFRVARNSYGRWFVDTQAANRRYDATSNTLLTMMGYEVSGPAHDDEGQPLPAGTVVGIMGDCSGGQTPWGTIITAEENVQDYYGDFESCWSSNNRFVAGQGYDPGAAVQVDPTPSEGSEFGRIGDVNGRQDRDHYGFLAEMDPGVTGAQAYQSVADGGNGLGHRKIGAAGRARWENAALAVNEDTELIDGQPVVIYSGNDRRSGRIYKFVSDQAYQVGMTRGQVRSLLDQGKIYVAHFAGLDHTTGVTLYDPQNPTGGGIETSEEAPGQGSWILMDVNNSDDVAPNASGVGKPGTKVGAALKDLNWNGIGGFLTNNNVQGALFTASTKIGVSELNRPEDLEYNARDISGTPRIYVCFTNHTRPAANNQDGVLSSSTPARKDKYGSIFSIEEASPATPGSSKTFKFWRVWKGSVPSAETEKGIFDAADPDNLAIDNNGGVWFGTDGNAGSTSITRADGIYYLDLNPAHKAGVEGIVRATYGKAFRVVSAPGDAEATGPWFTPDGTTLFFNVQHPGEETPSTWPQNRAKETSTVEGINFKND